MSIYDYLKSGELVLGLVTTVFVAIVAFLGWLDRRGRRYADGVRSASDQQHDRTQGRLSTVEGRLSSIEGDVQDMSTRITLLEHKLGTLATAKDVGDVAVRTAGLSATVDQISGKMDTLYRAALQRSKEAP